MKYKEDLIKVLSILYPGKTRDEVEELSKPMLKEVGLSLETLDKLLQEGVENGVSAESQLEDMKRIFMLRGGGLETEQSL